MQAFKQDNSGKTTSARATATTRKSAVFLFVLGIFMLLLTQSLVAETGTGMINRAPLTKAVSKPSELEKLSTDLDEIIKSINEIPDEVEDNTVTAEPEQPVEQAPVKKTVAPAPVIAKPEEVKPVEVKAAKKAPVTKPVKPVLSQPVMAKPEAPSPVETKPEPLKNAQKKHEPVTPAKTSTKVGYLKLAANGEKLNNNTEIWACVEDVKSGLVWEVKSNNDDIRDKDHLYSWFDPSQQGGITDTDIRINREYFPEAIASWYWTASSNEENSGYAWYVLFKNGISLNDLKKRPKHVRLVRAGNKA
jgi:hypothetical protein